MKAVVALTALVAAISISASSARAAGSLDEDVRCLAVADRLAQSTDPKAKETGKMAQVFFLGRVDAVSGGRPTAAVLAAAMVDAARRLTGDFAKAEANRCSGVMKASFGLLAAASPIANKSLQASKPAAGR